MKTIIISLISMLLFSCYGKLENNSFIVTKKVEYKKDNCVYYTETFISRVSGDIYRLTFYDSCNCYKLGDTLKIKK